MPIAPPSTAAYPGADSYLRERQRKLAHLLGKPLSGLRTWEEDFTKSSDYLATADALPPGWTKNISGGGTVARNASRSGGWMAIDSTATNGNWALAATNTGLIANLGAGSFWGFEARLSLSQANPNNQGWAVVYLGNMANDASLSVGYVGSLDSAKIIVQHSGNFGGQKIVLAPLDVDVVHVVRVVHRADGILHCDIDDGSEVTGTYNVPMVNAGLNVGMYAQNGGAGAGRAILTDYITLVAEPY